MRKKEVLFLVVLICLVMLSPSVSAKMVQKEKVFILLEGESASELLNVCRQLVWKLSHNHSPTGKTEDSRPGTISRLDITYRLAQRAIENVEKGTS